MKEFIKSFFSFGLATSLGKLLGLILLPIYTKYFSKAEYGIIDLIQTIVSVSTIFGLLQLETSLQRYYYEYSKIKKKLFISSVFILITVLSVIICIVLVVFSKQISKLLFHIPDYSTIIILCSLQLPLTNISMLGLVLLRYEKRNLKFLFGVLANVLGTLIFIYIFLIVLKMQMVGYFYAQLFALIISTACILYYIKDSIFLKINIDFCRMSFNYALPQFPARIGSVLLSQGNKFFMLSFLTISAIGLYSVSLKLGSIMQLFYTTFIMAWAPFMHEQFKKKGNKVVFASVLPLVSIVIFLLISVVALFSAEIFKLVVSTSYFEGHSYLGGISLYFGLFIVKEMVDIGPKIQQKTKYLSYTFIISLILNFTLLYFLIRTLGLKGVVLTLIATNIFLVFFSWYISNRLYYIAFNILLFLLLLTPVCAVCVVSMFFDFSLLVRILIAVLMLFFYIGLFLVNFSKFKLLKSNL